eukprot:TRINITY_DN109335_c0_g1_i1.p1 TRINITY_DN109335_c0_g1~~TRINITY_DN109335_c0_g1_i1.p1  ORF type:complete len:374 (+),score=122.58 TRINITY_DN109335_c0_g1_i1:73-1194(+)
MQLLKASLLGLCLVHLGEAVAVKFEDPKKLAVVPKVLNADTDGLPQLPELSNDISDEVADISSHIATLRQKLTRVQKDSRTRLAKQKKIFDRKLKEQEKKNKVVVNENAKLAKSIMKLKTMNTKILDKIEKEEKENDMRRGELKSIETQLMEVKASSQKALAQADDSNAPELTVLRHLHAKADQKEEDDEDESESPESFLQIEESTESSELESESVEEHPALAAEETDDDEQEEQSKKKKRAASAEPEGVVNELSGSIKALRRQSKKSENTLKVLFQKSFKQGVARRMALLAQQKQLQLTLKQMKEYQVKLKKAQQRLLKTRKILLEQIKSEGAFLGRLKKVADAPAAKVDSQLKSLRKKKEAKADTKDSEDF